MTRGTKSLLFGTHQFLLHPIYVTLAWRHLYGAWPGWRDLVCIFIHDWGYWGCKTMDGEDGELHPLRGAELAYRWFGPAARDLVLYHSRHFALMHRQLPSKLCWADKMSVAFEPWWLYIIRGLLSGEIHEYMREFKDAGLIDSDAGYVDWFLTLRDNMIWMAKSRDAASMPYTTPSTKEVA